MQTVGVRGLQEPRELVGGPHGHARADSDRQIGEASWIARQDPAADRGIQGAHQGRVDPSHCRDFHAAGVGDRPIHLLDGLQGQRRQRQLAKMRDEVAAQVHLVGQAGRGPQRLATLQP